MKAGDYYKTDDQVFRVEGEKAAIFLHGQLSQSIKDMKSGEARYSLLLTNKGKVIADLYVYAGEGCFFLSVNKVFSARVHESLAKLAPLSKVIIEPQNISVFHILDEHVSAGTLVFRTDRLNVPGYDVFSANADLFAGKEMSWDAVELLRVKNGVPFVGRDVTEDHLPQEGRLDRALHFNKGCYVGQEVIARLHFRGHVNKILGHFCGDENLSGALEINDAAGQKIGNITSLAVDPATNQSYLLAYVSAKLPENEKIFANHILLRRLS